MLNELTITNFVIIDRLRISFDSGFNVLTGETGAGKSIIVDAVSLLLGGRASSDFVRGGEKSAFVEGIFHLPPTLQARISPVLEREGLEEAGSDALVLGREIRATGRNFCRVNGRTVSLNLLAEIAAPLVDIHGQHQHLSLMQAKMHRALLDRFAGVDALRAQVTAEYKTLQAARKELSALQQDAQHIARRIDQLHFQVAEIQAADLQPNEEKILGQERIRLANAEKLNQLSGEAHRLLNEGAEEQAGISDLLGRVLHHLNSLQQIDSSLEPTLRQAEDVSYQIEDLVGQLQNYADKIEYSPQRLQEVEERLGLIYALKRKYGRSIAEVVAFGERAQTELDAISHAEDRIENLQAKEETLRHSLGQLAAELSEKRRVAGQEMARGVEAELALLGMEKTQFVVNLERVADPKGVYVSEQPLACDENGIDRVAFLISPNPGEPLKPMVKIASGGETSRLMLALKSVLASVDETPTLIFDEIDQGIGGRVGGVVGRKLRELAHNAQHQVLCITHLPQLAAFGDLHYHVSKQIEGEHTQALVRRLEGDAAIDELAQMLGNLTNATRASAREMKMKAEGRRMKDEG